MKKETSVPKVTIRNKPGSEGKILTGANTELLIDGKPVRGATNVKFEVGAKKIAKVTIEMYASVELDVAVKKVTKKNKKLQE